MLVLFVAAALAQTAAPPASCHDQGAASAEVALAFIRRRDPATAERLAAELRPWLAGAARTDPTVDAAATELKTMFDGHAAMWGDDPDFAAAAEAAALARRCLPAP
jgi:hypothetical protein